MRCVAGWAGGRWWVAGAEPAAAAFPVLRALLLPPGQAAVNGAEGSWVGCLWESLRGPRRCGYREHQLPREPRANFPCGGSP